MQEALSGYRNPSLSARRAKALGVLVALIGLFGALSMPSSASALSQPWSCSLAVDSWCNYPDNHSWALVSVQWGTGSTAVNMCAKIQNSAGSANGTRNCATAAVVYSISQPAYIGPNTWAYCANGSSGGPKTLNCWATT
jgi:hypothetical protein